MVGGSSTTTRTTTTTTATATSEKKDVRSCIYRNRVLLVVVLTALIGITAAVWSMELAKRQSSLQLCDGQQQSCHEHFRAVVTEVTKTTNQTVEVTHYPPSDVVVALDRSGSVGSQNWDKVRAAAVNFVQSFRETTNKHKEEGGSSSVQAGAVVWSSRSSIEALLTDAIDDVATKISGIGYPRYNSRGTLIALPLARCMQLFEAGGNPDPETSRLCTIITDGGNEDDSGVVYTADKRDPLYRKLVWDHCVKYLGNQACTVDNIVNHMKANGWTIVGIYICEARSNLCSMGNLQTYSSCDNDFDGCDYFHELSSFEQLRDSAKSIANRLTRGLSRTKTETVVMKYNVTTQESYFVCTNSTQTVVCTTSNDEEEWVYLLFLLMVLPLLAYVLSKFCTWRSSSSNKEETATRRLPPIIMVGTVEEDPPPPYEEVVVISSVSATLPPKPPVDTPAAPDGPPPLPSPRRKEKKFKWDISAAQKYLWASGGAGMGVMQVNFGAKLPPPPSVPQLEPKNRAPVRKEMLSLKLLTVEADRPDSVMIRISGGNPMFSQQRTLEEFKESRSSPAISTPRQHRSY